MMTSSINNTTNTMAEAEQQLLQKSQRDINIIADSTQSRASRKSALVRLDKEAPTDPQLASSLLLNGLATSLLSCWSDPSENSREYAVSLLFKYFLRLLTFRLTLSAAEPHALLAAIVPVLHARLATPIIMESSEEIRLLLLKNTNELVLLCQDKASPFIQELSEIIMRTLHDPFPDVKKVLYVKVIIR
jgi:dynein assembly factor 5